MICTTCGLDNPAQLIFCQACGQRLAPRVAPPTPPVGLNNANLPPKRERSSTLPRIPNDPSATPPPADVKIDARVSRPPAPDLQFSNRPISIPPADSTGFRTDVMAVVPEFNECVRCGHRNDAALRFCISCGNKLRVPDNAATHVDTAQRAPEAVVASTPPGTTPEVRAAAPAPIAVARVVGLGDAPAPEVVRVCARCRGSCDAKSQFCRFCGASLVDAPAQPVSVPRAAPNASPEPPRVAPVPAPAASYVPAPSPGIAPIASTPAAARGPIAAPTPLAAFSPASASPSAHRTAASEVRASSPTPAIGRIVLVARDGAEGPSFPLTDQLDIGRTEGDIIIGEDRYLSPRHVRVARRNGHLFARDLGTVNGIYFRITSAMGKLAEFAPPPGGLADAARASLNAIPGIPLTTPPSAEVTIRDQALFLIGQQVLKLEIVKDADLGLGTAAEQGTLIFGTPAAPRYARLCQRTVEGVTRDVFYIRQAETVLGRESGDIVFTEDPFLSRRHAVIRVIREPNAPPSETRFTLADLGSSNGTFLRVNGEIPLQHDDQFRVGQQLFKIDLRSNAAETAGARPTL